VTLVTSDQFFGSRRLAVMDQLGSVGTYYPWGENRGSTNPQDTWSFGTYWTDSVTGLDYANNRYYFNSLGRFMTPDPAGAGAASGQDPVSWNRYAYTGGDPVNRSDPSGLLFYPGYESCVANDAASDETAACPINDDDTSLYGEIGSCFASDNFTPSPSPYCQQGGPPPRAPQPKPEPEPQCDIKEQFAPVPGTFHAGVHTYLDVEIDGIWSVLEATFSGSNPFSTNAQMEALITSGLGGGLGIDHPATDTTAWDAKTDTTLTAQQLCDDAESIMNAATAFRQNHAPGSAGGVPYNLFGSHGIPNSNSFVRYLLTFAPDLGTVPHSKRARGWSNLVLGQ
jgi:RHS repeat-associated protein